MDNHQATVIDPVTDLAAMGDMIATDMTATDMIAIVPLVVADAADMAALIRGERSVPVVASVVPLAEV